MDLSPEDIRALVAQREGKKLEFKSGLPRDEKTARSLAAFANTRGGILLVGVGDRGEILGAPHPPDTSAHLHEIAQLQLEPPLVVQCGIVSVNQKPIVWCSVPLSPRRPHAVLHEDGRREIVARVGSSNRVATGATLAALESGRRGSASGLDPLQRSVLAWVAERDRSTTRPGGDATVADFAKARNVGIQRARRAFTQLEIAGMLVAHGVGAKRTYAVP
ncbi:MAG: ATP-binding protein [Planctomycetota bacterium]|nr:ATP-binding protein [Planctomycetota bacterium]